MAITLDALVSSAPKKGSRRRRQGRELNWRRAVAWSANLLVWVLVILAVRHFLSRN